MNFLGTSCLLHLSITSELYNSKNVKSDHRSKFIHLQPQYKYELLHINFTSNSVIQSSTDKCVFRNQMFGGSSQHTNTAEHAIIKLLCTVQTMKQCLAVVISWEDPPNISLMAAKNSFVGQPSNFRVCILLKSSVTFTFFCPKVDIHYQILI